MRYQIVVGVTKMVSDRLGHGGIADRMIWFNGFPFLDNKEEHSFGVPVSQVMTTNLASLTTSGLSVQELEKLMTENAFQGYPVVEDDPSKILVGYIGRTELRYGLDRQKRDMGLPAQAQCVFSQSSTHGSSTTPFTPSMPDISYLYTEGRRSTGEPAVIDFSRFTNHTPITVHPRLPLETVMELFKKMGPRVILVEHHGKLIGLVTVKDCLKYQFKAEAHVHPKDDAHHQQQQQRLWDIMRRVASTVRGKIATWSRGRIMLGEPDVGTQHAPHPPPGLSEAYVRTSEERPTDRLYDDINMELEDHFELRGTGSR